MALRKITLDLPENVYLRLHNASIATKQPLDQVVLRAVQAGIPPDWKRYSRRIPGRRGGIGAHGRQFPVANRPRSPNPVGFYPLPKVARQKQKRNDFRLGTKRAWQVESRVRPVHDLQSARGRLASVARPSDAAPGKTLGEWANTFRRI